MASKKKQRAMVFERIPATSPAVASEAWSSLTPPALKPRNTSKGSDGAGCRRSDVFGQSDMPPAKEPSGKPSRQLSTKHNFKSESDNLSPDCCRRGIKVTLDNNNMWNQFFRCRTEMIVTKEGSRMFPSCRFRVSGLQSSKNYVFVMDIMPADDHRYKWDGTSWRVDGKAQRLVKSELFFHHDSPATGQQWMQNPVSFYRLKLTTNISDGGEKTVLHPAQRYLPRLHVVQTDKATKDLDLNGPDVVTFAFQQMEFMAVTAYHNTQFLKLKVDYNPFSKGLKEDGVKLLGQRLKVNAGTNLSSDGGHMTKEQCPAKKSLKSLLANHKPRNSKPADPSLAPEVKEKSVNVRPGAKGSPGCSSSSAPAPKLFSDLMREAHVSLQRCDVDRSCAKSRAPSEQISGGRAKQRNIKQSPPQSSHAGTATEAVDTNAAKKKVKESKSTSNSPKPKDNVSEEVTEASVHKSKLQSEASAKPLKRPAPLPLPALARFLKQHSLQSKKAKSQPDPPTSIAPKSAFQLSCPGTVLQNDTTKVPFGGSSCKDPDSVDLGQAKKSNYQCSSSERDMPNSDRSTSALPRSSHRGSPVLAQSDHLCCNFESTLCPTPGSVSVSGPGESVLPSVCLPHLPPDAVPITSPSKAFMPLPDPNCSSFMFEPLSPASSPEPLPTLPASLALALDPNSPEQAAKRPLAGEMLTREESVFKWHTLLPPSEAPFIDATYPTFQPALQQLPLPMTLHNNTQPASQSIFPPHSSIPSFQDNEQSLPFPAELSPLALPLALSPTFSSLDGEGLSPTPSIADLVQFFSNNDELGMGVEFPSTEEVPPPCLPTVSVETTTADAQLQVRAGAAPKTSKTKKRSRSRKLDKPSTDEELQESDTTMRPNMEEVEEQLFISFTSKEALKLHVSDPSEDPEPSAEDHVRTENPLQVEVQPQLWAEVQPLQVSTKPLVQNQQQLLIKGSPQPQKPEPEPEIQPGPTDEVELPLQTESSEGTLSQTGPLLSTEAGKLMAKEIVREEHPSDRRPPKGPRKSKFKQVPVEERETVAEVDAPEEVDQTIVASEKLLLRDMKLMRHRQIIHPVLQEVGLKMNLLDPTLTIDLQYLGVQLPIPPPGAPQPPPTQEEPLMQSVSPAFVSRTGKTSDMTQIKGWREKFTPSEASTFPEADKPEPPPVTPEAPKKNLSAFCSDMLDEYLENEGKLIDQRAANFSDNLVEAPAFQLPLNSSFSRPLNTGLSSSSPLISGFVPPSKRPKLPAREPKMSRKGEKKQRIMKKKPNPRDVGQAESSPSVQSTSPAAEVLPLSTEFIKEKTNTAPEPLRKKKRFKPKSSTQSLDLPRPSADMAPLESDTELDFPDTSSEQPVMTRALLKQRDLEDGVMWEGKPRTSVTEERASIALTSLFTLSGFVSENPTAPIQLPRRQAPYCLNDFCRLGCICSSLARNPRNRHCGRPDCMFGCSCLKQKVVLLKHLDSSDSGSSHHSRSHRKKRHKKRMKMAYVLKEADSAAHPAERIKTLWKRQIPDSDPEPVYIPKSSLRRKRPQKLLESKRPKVCDGQQMAQALTSTCARVRVFSGKRDVLRTKAGSSSSDSPTKLMKKKPIKKKMGTRKGTEVDAKVPQTALKKSKKASAPPAESTETLGVKPKFAKLSELLNNLTIMAECTWDSVEERNMVIMTLCKMLAQGRLDKPLWIQNHLIRPFTYTVNEDGEEPFVQYRVYISKPPIGKNKSGPDSTVSEKPKAKEAPVEVDMQEVKLAKPVEDWQRALDSEMDEDQGEEVEDWQREVESDDLDKEEPARQKLNKDLGLPFLSAVSPAGFLSANLKQPNNSDVVQVNGKFYPLAKIQLGMMGALHPANRLAAYLTGRVGVAKRPPSTSSSVESSRATPTPPVTSSSTPTSSEPTHTSPPAARIPVQLPTPPAVSTGPLPSAVQPTTQMTPLPVATTSTSQKMILKPVLTKTGEKLYRREDGKLVRLVPFSQLKTVTTETPKGVATGLPLPGTGLAPTVPQQPSAVPAATCGLSGLKHFTSPQNLLVVPSNSQLQQPGSGRYFIRINATPTPIKASVTPTQPAGPAPVPLTPSEHKEGAVFPASGSDLTPTLQTPPAAQNPSVATSASPSSLHRSGPQTQLEVKKVQVTTEEQSSDGETDDSSENSDEEKALNDVLRHDHNQRERCRRLTLMKLFEELRKVMDIKTSLSRIGVLDKATTEIQNLAATELDLLLKKRSLSKRRDVLLSTIAPPGGSSPSRLSINCSDTEAPESPQESWDKDESAALEILRCLLRQTHCSDLQLLDLVRQEITDQQDLMRILKGMKRRLKKHRESLVQQISEQKGQSCEMIHPESPSPEPGEVSEKEEASPSTSAEPSGPAHSLPAVVWNNTSIGIRLAPPSSSPASEPQQEMCLDSCDPPEKKQRTLPNILSRSRLKDKVLTQKAAETPAMPGAADAPQHVVPDPDPPAVPDPDPPAEPDPPDVTTLLHELSFLNQTSIRLFPRKASAADASCHQTTHLPDTKDGLNGHVEPKVESVADNLKGSVLAPPPLLQMRVDAANKAEPEVASSQLSEEGVTWRPMPRLVPLGLKGAPPT